MNQSQIRRRGADSSSPINQLRWEMDRLIERFVREPLGYAEGILTGGMWSPAIDISESNREVVVRAELAGVDPKDIELSVLGDALTLSGEKCESPAGETETACHTERRYGPFKRVLRMPTEVDPDNVAADYANGVLTIRVRKIAAAAAKRIAVRASDASGG